MGETADGLAPPSDLTAVEGRVLGCLIEKERATPQNYPLTLNALRLACNQSTNRDPVVEYEDREVEAALTSLRERGLTRIVYSTSNRAAKYRHVLDENLRVNDAELATLAVLLLRGPQTLGEIKGRSDRLHAFRDLAEVEATADALAARETGPLVRRLERRPGQKDARYIQLLTAASAGPQPSELATPAPEPHRPEPYPAEPQRVEPQGAEPSPAPAPPQPPDGGAAPSGPAVVPAGASPAPVSGREVDELRDEVTRLREELATLRTEFDAFRAAFG